VSLYLDTFDTGYDLAEIIEGKGRGIAMSSSVLSWDKAGARWKKIYRGRVWYSKRGLKKGDKVAHRQAVNSFNEWKTTADADAEAHKPHADQYAQAIALRQTMLDWLLLERGNEEAYDNPTIEITRDGKTDTIYLPLRGATYQQEHDQLAREIDRLKVDFARTNPPALNTPATLPVDPLEHRPLVEKNFWRENLKALRQHDKWTGTTEHAQTVGANIDTYLAMKKKQAESGQIGHGRYVVLKYHLEHFRRVVGELALEHLTSNTFANYHANLLNEIKAGTFKPVYAKSILASIKEFVRWLWETEAIENLPRNLAKLQITADPPEIKTLSVEEIKTLLAEASGRTRLYITLMLNIGATSKDLSDLTPAEIDWERGRIKRRRSKTKREKNVPIVDYPLWATTFDLLKRYGNRKGERAILTQSGKPLRRWEDKGDGKTRNADNVRWAWQSLADRLGITKSAKLCRKTSASMLAEHETFGRFASLFLGHTPKTTAERHYVKTPQDLFDAAITWLGEQFGIDSALPTSPRRAATTAPYQRSGGKV
jgi:integrase